MRLIDRIFTRRRRLRRFANVPAGARRRLNGACRELTEAEDALAEQLGLADPPRLLLIDEEQAVVITPAQREEIAATAARRRD